MKKLYFLLIICLLPLTVLSQAPAIQWQKSFGGTGEDRATSIVQTADGGYIIVGNTASTDGDVDLNHGLNDIWLIKIDANGIQQWQTSYGGSGNDYCNTIKSTTDGGYIIGGSTTSVDGDVSSNNGNSNCWVIKIDASGTIDWDYAYSNTSIPGSYVEDIIQTDDGGYIISGGLYVADLMGGANQQLLILKITSSGTFEWKQQYGGEYTDWGRHITQTSDGGFITCGSNGTPGYPGHHAGALSDLWVLKLDALGEIEWQRLLGGWGNEGALAVHETGDGDFIVTGMTSLSEASNDGGDVSGSSAGWDYWMINLSSSGDLQWQNPIGTSLDEILHGSCATTDGGFILTGQQKTVNFDFNDPSSNFFVAKVDSAGNEQWTKTIGGSLADISSSIIQASDNGYLLAGKSNSADGDVTSNQGAGDFWIVKLEPALSIADFDSNDIKIYPNPVQNGVLSFECDCEINAVNAFDLSGKKVYSKRNPMNVIEVTNFAKGIYFFKFESRGEVFVKKIVVE